jgi:hypothetical protein
MRHIQWPIVLSFWAATANGHLQLARRVAEPSIPKTTPPPAVHGGLEKRGTRTCGYREGSPGMDFTNYPLLPLLIPAILTCQRPADLAYTCVNSGSGCLYDESASAIGCCATTAACNIYTACLPRASSAAASTANLDRTRYWYDINSCLDLTSAFVSLAKDANHERSQLQLGLCLLRSLLVRRP